MSNQPPPVVPPFAFPPGFTLPAPPPYIPPPPVDTGPWFYAQVNDSGQCVAVTQASSPITADHMVRIESLATELVGKVRQGDEWTEPAMPAPTEVPRHITRLSFLQRFHDSEAVAIDLASMGATPQAAAMRRYMALVNAATYIDLARPDTRAGVLALEAAGLLQAGRATAILDAPITDGERPRAGTAS